MSELSNFLVESIMAESAEMENVIVVYSGRFQPFHKGHFATYQNLIKKFGKDNVYIATSNKTDNQKSPFDFREKKTIMT
jgi:cytidyltransferase-like protein